MKSKDWIPDFNSKFKNELKNFIIFKRSNGYKYGENNCYRLLELDKFFISLNTNDLTISQEVVDKWMMQCNEKNKKVTKAKYFTAISTFCEYLRLNGYENVIQPESPKLKFKSEFIPYIFKDEEIKNIFKNLKDKLNKSNDLDNNCFYILITLYYCCGLRRSEALNLAINNYDDINKTITIIDGKNNISRIVCLTDSICCLINNYLKIRKNNGNYLFITNNGKRYNEKKLYYVFHKLLLEVKIPVRYDGKRQRIHDLRHTFCVNALKQMQSKGFDLYTSLPLLSVYLGHKSIVETEYYLRLIEKEAENISEITVNYLQNLYNKKGEFYHGDE